MPNFITDRLDKPALPFEEAGYRFLWSAEGRDRELIMVDGGGEEFFVTIKPDGAKTLVKGEKISRPHQVLHLQQALLAYAKASGAHLLHSNLKSARRERTNSVIKDISYFAENEFDEESKILLEVGFGSGRHLLYQAQSNPDHLIIGVEIHKPSLEQVARQCELLGLANVILIDYDSRILMEFLASNCVERIFVHFPVPWDKKPHRRVIGDYFVREALRVLKVGGTLELRTDSEEYFRYSLELFLASDPQADVQIFKNFDLGVSSKYEDRWKRLEKNIYDLTLKCHKKSKKTAVPQKLQFNFYADLGKIKVKFAPRLERGDGFFAHFEELYSSPTRLLIRASFGASERSERAFVIIDEDGARYFPSGVYATQANQKAHKIMQEWLDE